MSVKPSPSRSTDCTASPVGHVPLAATPTPVTVVDHAPVDALYDHVSATPSPLKSTIELPMLEVPGCVNDADWPAIVAVPVRGAVPVFACAWSVTVPLPRTAPVGLVTVIHVDPLVAVQLQDEDAVTLTVAVSP